MPVTHPLTLHSLLNQLHNDPSPRPRYICTSDPAAAHKDHACFILRSSAGPPLRIMTLWGRGIDTKRSHREPAESANGHRSCVNPLLPQEGLPFKQWLVPLLTYKIWSIENWLELTDGCTENERNIILCRPPAPPVGLCSSYLGQYSTVLSVLLKFHTFLFLSCSDSLYSFHSNTWSLLILTAFTLRPSLGESQFRINCRSSMTEAVRQQFMTERKRLMQFVGMEHHDRLLHQWSQCGGLLQCTNICITLFIFIK